MFRILLLSFCLSSGQIYAGGFDSSGRPFDIIFGQGNLIELSASYIDPSVSLGVVRNQGDGITLPATRVNEITNQYAEPRIGLRLQINDIVSCASQIERPFRFKTMYQDDAFSYQSDNTDTNSQIAAPIESEYSSESISLACSISYEINHTDGMFKQSFFSLIGGPKLQRIEGAFSSDLTNMAVGINDNYSATLDGSTEWGYLFGIAYEIPEIAFRASLFFHNEIKHDLTGEVFAPLSDFSGLKSEKARSKTLTPMALNLRIQSGLAEDWLAFVEFRWGDWSSVNEIYVDAGDLSQDLVLFKNDTINYKLGLGYRVNERLSLGGYFESLFDINPEPKPPGIDGTNIRNPQGNRYSLAFGGKYALTSKLSIAMGGSYYYIERGRFADSSYTVNLDSSHAIAFSGTLAYMF